MNSPTHTLLAMAAFSKQGDKRRNWAVFIGSIIPDLFIYVAWVWLTFVKGESRSRIWDEIYFEEPMQLVASVFNSVPIYIALALTGYIFRAKIWGKLLMFFAFAALLHIAFDFPVHNHDAYAHFWPFTDWRFISPFSYYEVEHHAGVVSLVEAVLGLSAIWILWQRFPKRWVKIVLGFFGLLYVVGQVIVHIISAGGGAG